MGEQGQATSLEYVEPKYDHRVALVIGQSYAPGASDEKDSCLSPLSKSIKSAERMAEKLEELGFEFVKTEEDRNYHVDLHQTELIDTMSKFRARVQTEAKEAQGTIAVLFFAGHACSINGKPHILPTHKVKRLDELADYAIPLDRQCDRITQIEGLDRINLVFLDSSESALGLETKEPLSCHTLVSAERQSGTSTYKKLYCCCATPKEAPVDSQAEQPEASSFTSRLCDALTSQDRTIEEIVAGVQRELAPDIKVESMGNLIRDFCFNATKGYKPDREALETIRALCQPRHIAWNGAAIVGDERVVRSLAANLIVSL